MSAPDSAKLRLKCNWRSHAAMVDIITNTAPLIWRGNDLDIQIGLFDGDAIHDDLSTVTSVIVELHQDRSATIGALWQKVSGTDFSLTACTQTNWDNGTGQHAVVPVTAVQTNVDMTGHTNYRKSFWLVVHVVLTSGKKKTYGFTMLEIEEDSAQLGLAPIGTTSGNARMNSSGMFVLKNRTTGEYRTIFLEGSGNEETLAFGPEE